MGILFRESSDSIRAQKRPSVFMRNRSVSKRQVTQTLIVCGNCNGFETLPRKTLLTADGLCESCGGRSFVLAVNFQFQVELARRINELQQLTF